MASLYNRGRFIWIQYRDRHGKIVRESTKFSNEDPAQVRRARQLQAEKNLEETNRPTRCGDWLWVPDFIGIRYASRTVTRDRYLEAWTTLQLFFEEEEIFSPQHLQRKHCFDYVTWRQKPDKSKGKYKAGHNTALFELKVLSIVMQEALERGLCSGNPCTKLQIGKAPRRKAPELTDAQYELIISKIPSVENPIVRDMLAVSIQIGRFQGCRIKETRLNLARDVDMKAHTITFTKKGGERFTTAMHPKLWPFFERLITEGKTWTWNPPAGSSRQWASTNWWRFLDRHGLKKEIGETVCFRSARVSVITTLIRKNVPAEKIKDYVGHASTTMQEIYKRLKVSDLSDCTDAL